MEETAYNYKAALNPKTFIIDSVELRPLSLGHLIVLETVHSPFLLPKEETIPWDINATHYVTALFLCGHTWEDNQLLLNSDELWKKEFGEFSQHHLDNVVKVNPDWNLDSRSRYFQHGYMNYFINSMPILDPTSPNQTMENNASGMDWKLNVKTIFATRFKYNESKILNMSLTQLYYEWASFGEINGMVRVRSAADQKAREYGAQQAAEFRRKMKELHAQKEQVVPC